MSMERSDPTAAEDYAAALDVAPPVPRGVIIAWAIGIALALVGLVIGLILAAPDASDAVTVGYGVAIAVIATVSLPLMRLVDRRGAEIYGCKSEAIDLVLALRNGDAERISLGIIESRDLWWLDSGADVGVEDASFHDKRLFEVALRRVRSLEDLLAHAGAYAAADEVAAERRAAESETLGMGRPRG